MLFFFFFFKHFMIIHFYNFILSYLLFVFNANLLTMLQVVLSCLTGPFNLTKWSSVSANTITWPRPAEANTTIDLRRRCRTCTEDIPPMVKSMLNSLLRHENLLAYCL